MNCNFLCTIPSENWLVGTRGRWLWRRACHSPQPKFQFLQRFTLYTLLCSLSGIQLDSQQGDGVKKANVWVTYDWPILPSPLGLSIFFSLATGFHLFIFYLGIFIGYIKYLTSIFLKVLFGFLNSCFEGNSNGSQKAKQSSLHNQKHENVSPKQ